MNKQWADALGFSGWPHASEERRFDRSGKPGNGTLVAGRPKGVAVFFHVQKLINPIVDDEPDPAAANALQEGLGGQFSEMRTMMQYLF
jgi:Manganese containing catalase